MKSQRSKDTDIPQRVKARVWERDRHQCIICHRTHTAFPNAHYIPRSSGGLGIEENIVTLCHQCHREYDQSIERELYKTRIRQYLKRKYPNWDENKLYYKK